jgi:hypothetical protein
MASSIYRLGNLSPEAVAGILCSLPLAAGMLCILSANTGLLASRPRDYMNETRCRLLYVFTEFLIGVIILTYVRQSLGSVRAHQVSLRNADRQAWELSCVSLVPFLRTVITWVEGTVRTFVNASLEIPYRTNADFLP